MVHSNSQEVVKKAWVGFSAIPLSGRHAILRVGIDLHFHTYVASRLIASSQLMIHLLSILLCNNKVIP